MVTKGGIPWNKGLKASAETRQKLSDIHQGQIPWNKQNTITKNTHVK